MRILIALVAGIALVLMHQLGGADFAHAETSPQEIHVISHAEMNHLLDSDSVMAEAPVTNQQTSLVQIPPYSHGSEHSTTCISGHDPCQVLAPADFNLPSIDVEQPASFQFVQNQAAQFANTVQVNEPPGRASLAVWRI